MGSAQAEYRDCIWYSSTADISGQRRGPTDTRAESLVSCPDSEERTGIRFEKERVYGYSGSEGAARQTLSPGDRAIRGSRR